MTNTSIWVQLLPRCLLAHAWQRISGALVHFVTDLDTELMLHYGPGDAYNKSLGWESGSPSGTVKRQVRTGRVSGRHRIATPHWPWSQEFWRGALYALHSGINTKTRGKLVEPRLVCGNLW